MYFVTTIRTKDNDMSGRCTRCIGYWPELSQAKYIITNNNLDEAGYYNYAVIEKFGPGLYPMCRLNETKGMWYRLYKNKVVKIKIPRRFKQVRSFGIG